MTQTVLYYSDVCPDTPAFVAELDHLQLEYSSVNITESMKNLKEFLNLRDNRSEFDEIKKNNFVGVPVLHTPSDQLIFDKDKLASMSDSFD